MDGSTPHMLSEEDLVAAALDPDALSAEARQHLATCPTCTERAASSRQFIATLTNKLYRWDCPSAQEISDYAAGWLRGKQRRTLTLHLRRCPLCREELQISHQFLAPVPTSVLAPVPTSVSTTARQRFFARPIPLRLVGQPLRALRGSTQENDGWPRQYQFEAISISLHRAAPAPGGSGAMLLGLISRAEAPPDSFTDIEVRLAAADAPDAPPSASEQIDDLGNFILSPIPTGRFNLVILLPEGDLVIEGLELSG